MCEEPGSADGLRMNVVVGVHRFVPKCSVANLKIDDIAAGVVHKAMGITGASLEPGAYSRR